MARNRAYQASIYVMIFAFSSDKSIFNFYIFSFFQKISETLNGDRKKNQFYMDKKMFY